MGELAVRVLSAAVLLPVAAAAVWRGGWAFDLLLALAGAAMLAEWAYLTAHMTWTASRRVALTVVGGVVLIAVIVAAHAIRSGPQGLALTGLLVAAVVATDIGAYAVGRLVGGPRLAPVISPGKTWAGLAGGVAAAALAATAAGMIAGSAGWSWAAGGAALGLCAQGGDLLESWCKRRAGAKDSGALIPGHGGALDRLDGFLAATPALWLHGAVVGPPAGLAAALGG